MKPLWQLYDEQGRPLVGCGTTREDALREGLLHGGAHVWIWRHTDSGLEVLLQRRAQDKHVWPDVLDISAAGHIDLGEDALAAARRESSEELGLEIAAEDLRLVGVMRTFVTLDSGELENEFQWLYLLQLVEHFEFKLQASEVTSVEWRGLGDIRSDLVSEPTSYAPRGDSYYGTIFRAIDDARRGA